MTDAQIKELLAAIALAGEASRLRQAKLDQMNVLLGEAESAMVGLPEVSLRVHDVRMVWHRERPDGWRIMCWVDGQTSIPLREAVAPMRFLLMPHAHEVLRMAVTAAAEEETATHNQLKTEPK